MYLYYCDYHVEFSIYCILFEHLMHILIIIETIIYIYIMKNVAVMEKSGKINADPYPSSWQSLVKWLSIMSLLMRCP